jgi:hypothetical protein
MFFRIVLDPGKEFLFNCCLSVFFLFLEFFLWLFSTFFLLGFYFLLLLLIKILLDLARWRWDWGGGCQGCADREDPLPPSHSPPNRSASFSEHGSACKKKNFFVSFHWYSHSSWVKNYQYVLPQLFFVSLNFNKIYLNHKDFCLWFYPCLLVNFYIIFVGTLLLTCW